MAKNDTIIAKNNTYLLMAAYKLTISGRVQGVFFRQFAVDAATNLGVTGWIKNDPEGTVSVLIQGDEHCLNQLMALLSKGPDFAHVTNITKEHIRQNGTITDFRISR